MNKNSFAIGDRIRSSSWGDTGRVVGIKLQINWDIQDDGKKLSDEDAKALNNYWPSSRFEKIAKG